MKIKLILITLIMTISIAKVAAQDEAIKSEIILLEKQEVKAILEKDTATLNKLWSPNFMVNAPVNKVIIGGQVKMVTSGFIEYESYVVENEAMMVKGDFVISMGKETVVTKGKNYAESGKTVHRRYTNIWQRQNGHWVSIARQASNICE